MFDSLVINLVNTFCSLHCGFEVDFIYKAFEQEHYDFFLRDIKNDCLITRMNSTDFLNNLVMLLDGGDTFTVSRLIYTQHEAFVKEPPGDGNLYLKWHFID